MTAKLFIATLFSTDNLLQASRSGGGGGGRKSSTLYQRNKSRKRMKLVYQLRCRNFEGLWLCRTHSRQMYELASYSTEEISFESLLLTLCKYLDINKYMDS